MEVTALDIVDLINEERWKSIKVLEASQDILKYPTTQSKPKMSKKNKVLLITAVAAIAGIVYGIFSKTKEFEDKVSDKNKERQDSGKAGGASVITETLAEMGGDEGMYGGVKSIGFNALKLGVVGGTFGFAGGSLLIPSDSNTKFIRLGITDIPYDILSAQKETDRYIKYIRSERDRLIDSGSKDEINGFIERLNRKPNIFTYID